MIFVWGAAGIVLGLVIGGWVGYSVGRSKGAQEAIEQAFGTSGQQTLFDWAEMPAWEGPK